MSAVMAATIRPSTSGTTTADAEELDAVVDAAGDSLDAAAVGAVDGEGVARTVVLAML